MATLEELRKKLEINRDDLDTELSEQAANYLYVAEKAVNAEMAFDIAKMGLDKKIAEVDERIRTEAATEGKKTTEKMIEMEIDRDAEVINKKVGLIRARGDKEVLRSLREAYYMRKDMLIQLAIKQRSEMESMLTSVGMGEAA